MKDFLLLPLQARPVTRAEAAVEAPWLRSDLPAAEPSMLLYTREAGCSEHPPFSPKAPRSCSQEQGGHLSDHIEQACEPLCKVTRQNHRERPLSRLHETSAFAACGADAL